MEQVDILIIGGGMAGAALAHAFDGDESVVLLEAEADCGLHATARTAALYSETYGNHATRALTVASGPFLRQPPEGLVDSPILSPRSILHVARADQMEAFAARLIEMQALVPTISPLTGPECRTLAPLLREGYAAAGILEPAGYDIDVDRLQQAYLRHARARGVRIITKAPVARMTAHGGGWQVESGAGQWQARIVINAAGAWADQVAECAGLPPLGLQAMRQTAALIDAPEGLDLVHLPFIADIEAGFYLTPSGGKLLVSPADETPVPPGDAQPEDPDIAVALERVTRACELDHVRQGQAWAGLRTFAPDRTPVIGFDPAAPSFFWVAGLGGHGVQTAPAVAALATALFRGRDIPDRMRGLGLSVAEISPARLREAGHG